MSSVEIKSVELESVRRGIDSYAADLLANNPSVEEIIVFGSFANDTYAPGSDVDLFIILSHADDRVAERMARFYPRGLCVPADVFPFTRVEMEERADSPLLKAVEASNWRYVRAAPSSTPTNARSAAPRE